MKKMYLLSLLSIIPLLSIAQPTFKKILDLGFGWHNSPFNIAVDNNRLIVYAAHVCYEDTFPCASINTFMMDTFNYIREGAYSVNKFTANPNSFVYDPIEHTVSALGSIEWEHQNGFYSFKSEYPLTKKPIKLRHFQDQGLRFFRPKLFKLHNKYYSYGQVEKTSTNWLGASIIHWGDSLLQAKKWNNFDIGSNADFINDMQATNDNHLVFLHTTGWDYNTPSHDPYYTFYEMDTSGAILKQKDIYYPLASRKYFSFLYTPSKNLIIADRGIPFHEAFEPGIPPSLSITKLTKNFESIAWTLTPPTAYGILERAYRVSDMIEANNGDIIIVGLAGMYQYKQRHGFFARVDKDNGQLKYMKLYTVPNTDPNRQEFGEYINSAIWHIRELDDGQLVMVGGTYPYDQYGQPGLSLLWIMKTNPDGCLDDFKCEDFLVDLSTQKFKSDKDFVNISNIWNIIRQNPNGLPFPIMQKYKFSLGSFVHYNNHDYYSLYKSKDRWGQKWEDLHLYFRQEGQKVWLIRQKTLFKEELVYDFSLEEGETFKTNLLDKDIELIVRKVDSITLLDGTKRKRMVLGCKQAGGITRTWIEGIGDTLGILAHLCGCNIDCDEESLVCYSQLERHLYQSPSWNSCWVTTSTKKPRIRKSSRFLQIYPNPSSGKFRIAGLNGEIQYGIYNLNGSLIDFGKTVHHGFKLSHPGIYILRLYLPEHLVTRKLVVE